MSDLMNNAKLQRKIDKYLARKDRKAEVAQKVGKDNAETVRKLSDADRKTYNRVLSDMFARFNNR